VELARLPNNQKIWLSDRSEVEFLYEEIFESRCYAPPSVQVDTNSVVFDVGANIGLASVFFATACNVASVFAFEPAPASFEVLEANFDLHEISGSTFRYALSDTCGTASFTHYTHASAKSGFYAERAADSAMSRAFLQQEGLDRDDIDWLLRRKFATRTFIVERRTLSNALRDTGVARIDLLKIDVEKSELDVLAGVTEADWQSGVIRQIVVEVHDVDDRLSYLIGMLGDRGYRLDVSHSTSPCSESHILSARLTS
jgi:FkbM family methyltransferase